MKIKSYRAPSLREALLQIKEELGEDALVLETKQVRAGGLLGFGAQNMIEVRVAPSPAHDELPSQPTAPPPKTRLDLTDDSAAAPPATPFTDQLKEYLTDPFAGQTKTPIATEKEAKRAQGAFATLAARAYNNQSQPQTPTQAQRSNAAPPFKAPIDRFELADTAPRNVPRRPNSPTNLSVEPPQPGAAQHPVNQELARLRAEMREMKFALGAFAGARTAWQNTSVETKDPALRESPYYELYREMLVNGVPPGVAEQAIKKAAPLGPRELRQGHDIGQAALATVLPNWVHFADAPLTGNETAAFIGPTGVGKTTTIAKLAAHISLRARRRVELITLDTYRIAAVQQLQTYAEIIGAGYHVARSVLELDELTRRFARHATVLIDTTGRSPHDLADQMDLADYLRAHDTLLKCLVLPATTQLNDAQHVLGKFALYGANRLVLTKLDETVQPGAAISIALAAALPLIYLCAGQRVPEDLERATPTTLAARALRPRSFAQAA